MVKLQILIIGIGSKVSYSKEDDESPKLYFLTGTNVEHPGVWTYLNGMELTFINHKWLCLQDSDGTFKYHGRNHLLININNDNAITTGAWCDRDGADEKYFICEKGIEN